MGRIASKIAPMNDNHQYYPCGIITLFFRTYRFYRQVGTDTDPLPSVQGTDDDLSSPVINDRTLNSITTHHTSQPVVFSKPAITPLHPIIDESRRTRPPLGKGAPLNIDNAPFGRGKRYIPGGWPVELRGDGHATATFPPLKRDAATGTYGGDTSTEWTRKKIAVDKDGNNVTRNTRSTKEYVSKLDLDSSTRHYPGNPAFVTTFVTAGGIDTTMVRPYPDQRNIRTSHATGRSNQQYLTDPDTVYYDNEGKWIDYDAKIHGGIFGKRPPRTYDASVLRNTNEAANERGVEQSVTNIARGFREFGGSNQVGLSRGDGVHPKYTHNDDQFSSVSVNVPTLSAALATTTLYDTHDESIIPPPVSPMKATASSSSPSVQIESVGVHHNPARIPPNSFYTSSLIGIETPAFRAQVAHTGKKLIPDSKHGSSLDNTSMIAKVPGENYAIFANDINEDEIEDSHNITKKILTEARLGKTTGRNTTSTMNATFYSYPDDILKDNEDGPAYSTPLIPVTSSNDINGITRSLAKFAAQGTVETLPPRVINYTNGPTRSMVYISGVEKDSIGSKRPATTNDGTVYRRTTLLNIPNDTATAVRDSHARAGIVSNVSPKPLIISEIKQSFSGNVGGGNPVLSLTGAPYGKTMEGIYVRTDTETLAPKPSVPLANNTTAVSGWNSKTLKENDKQLDIPVLPIPLGVGPNRIGGAHIRNNLRLHTGIGTVSPTSILVVPSTVSVATGLTSRRENTEYSSTISNNASSVRNNLIPSPMRIPHRSESPSSPFFRPPSSSPIPSRESLNDSPTNFIPSASSSPLPSPSALDSTSVYSSSGVQIPALNLPRDRSLDNTFSTVRFDPAPALPAAGRPSPVREVAEQSKRTYRVAYTDVHDPRMVEFSALSKTQRTADHEIDNQKLETVRLKNEDPSTVSGNPDATSTRSFHSTGRKNKGIRNTDIHEPQIYATSALGYDAMRENLYGKEKAYSPEQLANPRGSNLPFPLPTLVGLPYYIKRDAEISYHTAYHHTVPVDTSKPTPLRSTQVRYEPMTVRVVGTNNNGGGNHQGFGSSGNGLSMTSMGQSKVSRSEPNNYAAAIAQLQHQIKVESK